MGPLKPLSQALSAALRTWHLLHFLDTSTDSGQKGIHPKGPPSYVKCETLLFKITMHVFLKLARTSPLRGMLENLCEADVGSLELV